MEGIALALFIFAYWGLLGYAALALFHSQRSCCEINCLAPCVGLAICLTTTAPISMLGFSFQQFALWYVVSSVLISVIVLLVRRPRFPVRQYIPFFAVFVAALAAVGRPLFEFGLDWISLANGDMANYSLLAQRLIERGFLDVPAKEDVVNGSHYSSLYWFIHVPGLNRAGTDLIMALFSATTGLNAHRAFMPMMLALHVVLISAGGAMTLQSRFDRRIAIVVVVLLSTSALTALGTISQLIAQVSGGGPPARVCSPANEGMGSSPQESSASGSDNFRCVFAAALIMYPEIVPFLGLAAAAYLVMSLWSRPAVRAPFLTRFGLAIIMSMVFAHRLTVHAVGYLFQQLVGSGITG